MITHKDFNTAEQTHTNVLIDYYEGAQRKHLVNIMDGVYDDMAGKRDGWRQRHIAPRTRNITKSIVEKSGMLFDNPPVLSIETDNSEKPVIDKTLNELLANADWVEFFQNVDAYTRLTKATVVLAQRFIQNETDTVDGQYRYNANNGEGLLLTLLHPGNCVVEKDQLGTITCLAYKIDVPHELIQAANNPLLTVHWWAYRKITADTIEDYIVKPTFSGILEEYVIHEEPNIEGIVPAVVFYDTVKPHNTIFPHPPEDIRDLQELYNLHLTDLEFSIAWQKQKTLFLDRNIVSSDGRMMSDQYTGDYVEGEYIQDLNPSGEAYIGGLGSTVTLERDGEGGTPLVKFDGPDTDLQPLDDIVNQIVKNVAFDWSVNIKVDGRGGVTSGFQLVVEEIQNLNLREKRIHFMRRGLQRLYKILLILYPELTQGTLKVDFAPPSLPVNKAEQQQLWERRIAAGLSSRKDYFMEVKNMSEDEALAKIQEIDALLTPQPINTPIEE